MFLFLDFILFKFMFILFQVTKMFLWVLVLANPAADPHDKKILKIRYFCLFTVWQGKEHFFDKSNPVKLS